MHFHAIFTVISLHLVAHSTAHHVKVNVAVYYESLCPDSRDFIHNQLYPALKNQNLSEMVDLQLVPFGKSTFEISSEGPKFNCHHGENECVGNTIHACALRKIADPSVVLSFVDCLMSEVNRNVDPVQFPIKQCAASRNVQNLADVENCSRHPDGKRYLVDYGHLTQQLEPTLKSVPTIVFNHQYKSEDNKAAQSNFKAVLCQYIKAEHQDNDHHVPEECAMFMGAMALGTQIQNALSLTILVFIATFYNYLHF